MHDIQSVVGLHVVHAEMILCDLLQFVVIQQDGDNDGLHNYKACSIWNGDAYTDCASDVGVAREPISAPRTILFYYFRLFIWLVPWLVLTLTLVTMTCLGSWLRRPLFVILGYVWAHN